MTLNEAVGFYHSLERFGIQPGLERINILLKKLGSPHEKIKCIHIAGTNGKGSTCTSLASILTKAGYKTGLYTSPYVIDFRERIQLNGEMISPEKLIEVTTQVKNAVEQLSKEGVTITEFEAVTAAAFTYYFNEKCDIAVLETGLGGRFDATNVIASPICSIITSVSLDHVKILGDTLEKIAFEKCGIIKNNCPVITGGEQKQAVLDVIKNQAELKNSPLYIKRSDEMFTVVNESIFGTRVKSEFGEFNIPWTGTHQLDNAALVLGAVEVLQNNGFSVPFSAVFDGYESAFIPARTEIISRSPLVILDGSHNDGSTQALANVLKTHLNNRKILSVMGMMADKDCKKAVENLVPCFSEVITVCPSNPRSMSAEELAETISGFSVKSTPVSDPCVGIKEAYKKLKDYDALVVCGSLYLAGDVRQLLIQIKNENPKI